MIWTIVAYNKDNEKLEHFVERNGAHGDVAAFKELSQKHTNKTIVALIAGDHQTGVYIPASNEARGT
jgi:hypothetical protein